MMHKNKDDKSVQNLFLKNSVKKYQLNNLHITRFHQCVCVFVCVRARACTPTNDRERGRLETRESKRERDLITIKYFLNTFFQVNDFNVHDLFIIY